MFGNIENYFQVSICQPQQLECVRNISSTDSGCYTSCEGLYITSYDKTQFSEVSKNSFLAKIQTDYDKYKKDGLIKFLWLHEGLT